jgi:membrane protein
VLGKAARTAQMAVGDFFADGCPKLAAAISYYTLFAIFPLAILGVAVLGFVFGSEDAREEIVQGVLGALPLTEEQGRADVEQLLREVTQGAGSASLLALVALAFSASGVMGALRFALNTVWGYADERPPLTGKLLDVLAVLGVGLALLASLGITVAARELGASRLVLGEVLPALVAFGVFLLVLHGVPARRTPFRDAWPGALVGAIGLTLAKLAFLVYLDRADGLSAVYAGLATVVAFLLFAWLSTNLFLLGAQVAVAWPCVRDDRLPEGPEEPFSMQVKRWLRGFVVRVDPPQPEPDTCAPKLSSPRADGPARR